MAAPIAFQSSRVKKIEREELRKAREIVLKEAKAKYEREERRLEQAKERGDDKWMLPSVSARLEQEQDASLKSKKTKKDKKKHKEKKKKKKKHKSSSSESDSDNEPVWVDSSGTVQSEPSSSVKGPTLEPRSLDRCSICVQCGWKTSDIPITLCSSLFDVKHIDALERDSWMTDTPDIFGGVTRQQLRDKKREEEDAKKPVDQNLLDQPGQHELELNPYWKDGGVGLPEEEKAQPPTESYSLDWLRKAYRRCQEMAEEQGKGLEEVAAERWGSLQKLKSLIADAEDKESQQKGRFRREKPGDYYDRSGARPHGHSSPHYKSKNVRERSRSPKYRSRSEREHSSGSRSRRDKSRSPVYRSKSERKRSRSPKSRSRKSRSRSRSRSPKMRRDADGKYSHSYDRYKDSLKDASGSKLKSLSGKFLKPGESVSSSTDSGKSSVPGWKKKGFLKPGEGSSESPSVKEKDRSHSDTPSWKKKEQQEYQKPVEQHKRKSSSDSSSSSSDSSSEVEGDPGGDPRPAQDEVPILSEQQMNEIGAKIIRAEIMGDEELAAKLKAQLEKAREAKKTQPVAKAKPPEKLSAEDEEEEVLLTRTTKTGMVLPVGERQHPAVGGKRRKKMKVATHGKDGKRERYFDDDDQHDLKSMVEREKMGTAEDQNMMFARLAGRSVEKTDDEFQIDDVFMNRANKKQSSSVEEERERALAITEHKKKAAALENCKFCFENVPKHLIIAIGVKVYLCLPNHKSLTEGHCLIVPMQHVPSGTAVDEDVWEEMQVYRKILVKMFSDRDEDCTFMETVMRLKYHPHMCVECVPMPREVGDMAPIYFKKAIMESETEWAQNKKLVDLSGRDVRKAVPKGFPYFSVDFGNQSGFAHVIEDEQVFPSYFGKEIIGGMLDVDTRLWRKPQKESFEDQRQKVLQFAEWWKPYDWTQKLMQDEDSD